MLNRFRGLLQRGYFHFHSEGKTMLNYLRELLRKIGSKNRFDLFDTRYLRLKNSKNRFDLFDRPILKIGSTYLIRTSPKEVFAF